MASRNRPVVLAILDGWGIAPPNPGNAITQAKLPNFQALWLQYVRTQLIAHGESVGLPKREPGNTETGHLNIGAGRIVYQDLPRINISIADGTFFQNPQLLASAAHVKKNSSDLHIMGLVGGGGVHSDLSHMFALLRFFHEQQIPKVFIHIFTDGRDSPPTAAMTYISQLQTVIERENIGQIASVMGRYFAMDRDFRWERTAKAYFALTASQAKTAPSVAEAVKQAYAAGETDEFLSPTLLVDSQNKPLTQIKNNDAVIFSNFRIDRPRQLTKAFVLPDFEATANFVSFDPYNIKYHQKHKLDPKHLAKGKPFARGKKLDNLYFVTMTEYEKNLPVYVAFPPQVVDNPLARVLSDSGLVQLHIAESEKERFVTYYFNGLREDPFPGEKHVIVQSPKIPTYDAKPEMSARELTNKLVSEINSSQYDFIVVNYANPDMVAHTGNIKATIKACEAVDECLGDLSRSVLAVDGALIITADHGNAEEMINPTTQSSDTEHNANPVPLVIISNGLRLSRQVPQGILADVAPTILSLLQLPIPVSMIGRNILSEIPGYSG